MNWIRILAIFIATSTLFLSLFKPVAAGKLEDMQSLQYSYGNIIEFSKKDFRKYVLTDQREYDVVIYYTLSQRCEHCVSTEQELREAAYSYLQAGKHQVSETNPRPIFFAKIEYNKNTEEYFRISEYQSVPILSVSTPEMGKEYVDTKMMLYPKNLEWRISGQDFVDAGKILEHLNKVTNNEVELKFTLGRILMGNVLIFSVLGILFFFKDQIGDIIQQRLIWMFGTAAIYIMCIGGTAFNMIHRVPTFRYGHDQSGNVVVEEYFQRNQRSQYAGEGYMVSMLMFLIGSSMVGFTYIGRLENGFRKEAVCLGVI